MLKASERYIFNKNFIVFIPKYRRKVIYYKLRSDIQKYIKDLCKW